MFLKQKIRYLKMRIFIIFSTMLVNLANGENIPELEEGTRTAIIEGRYNGSAFSGASPDLGNFLSSKSAQLSIIALEETNQFNLQVLSWYAINFDKQLDWLYNSRCCSKSKLAWRKDLRSIWKTQFCRIRSRSSVCTSWAIFISRYNKCRVRQRFGVNQTRDQPSWNELRSCWRDKIEPW